MHEGFTVPFPHRNALHLIYAVSTGPSDLTPFRISASPYTFNLCLSQIQGAVDVRKDLEDLIPTTGVDPSIASPAISKSSNVSITTTCNTLSTQYIS